MKIIIDKMPTYSAECIFSREDDNWKNPDKCTFTNRDCTLCDEGCGFLIERDEVWT